MYLCDHMFCIARQMVYFICLRMKRATVKIVASYIMYTNGFLSRNMVSTCTWWMKRNAQDPMVRLKFRGFALVHLLFSLSFSIIKRLYLVLRYSLSYFASLSRSVVALTFGWQKT